MISKKQLKAVTLQLPTRPRYKENLERLLAEIEAHSDCDIIAAPEVYLTGFDYEHISTAAKFGESALKKLKKQVGDQILILSLILNTDKGYVNQAVVIHKHKIIHRQNKAKLFKLGDEHSHFAAGKSKKIKPFDIEGRKYAILVCFELRFKELWQQIEGADIVVIVAKWGLPRKSHLEILSRALAVMNQTFVIVSDSSDSDMASSSALITPFGEVTMDDSLEAIEGMLDMKLLKKMRRYIVLE